MRHFDSPPFAKLEVPMVFRPRKITRRLAALLLAVSLLPVLSSPCAAAAPRTVRVGLYFGSGALPTANLANETGSGFQFGTYSQDGAFTALGATGREKITVCKDENLYLSGGGFYETPTAGGGKLIGAYHLQLPGSYASYEAALAAANACPFGFPAYVGGQYVVRFEFYSAAANAASDLSAYPAASTVGHSPTCYTVVDTETGEILFEYDCGAGAYLAVAPAGAGDEGRTWFKNRQYYGGFQYMRRSGNDLTVVNVVSEDLYVAGVLPYEFVVSGTVESLKAGAVAIRTFARATTKHSASGFDLCNTTDCQVYRGAYTGEHAAEILQAVRETAGLCAYYDGKPIQAVYSSSDGGATEDAANAWGTDHPYLKGKPDPYESTISFGGQSWSYPVSASDLQALLQKQGCACGTVTGLAVTATTPNGNVNEITVTDSGGKTFTFTGDKVRVLQGLPGVQYMSRRFTIRPNDGAGEPGGAFSVYDGKTTSTAASVTAITAGGKTSVSAPAPVITGSGVTAVGAASPSSTPGSGWTITGSGYGHNVGLSQWGAYAMGRLGYTYDEILRFYYTGITIQ